MKFKVRKELQSIVDQTRSQIESGTKLTMYFKQISDMDYSTRVQRLFEFPGRSVKESENFALLLRVCSIILDNMKHNKVVPVRDVYYQDVAFFKSQNQVVKAVERLCLMFRVSRETMNITQSPNGLIIVGNFSMSIAFENGQVEELKEKYTVSLIPVEKIMHINCSKIPRFVLVVEKEAVFAHLNGKLPDGILITGKGFPDHATRRLLNAISVTYPSAPIFGLVDSDPHGILILRTYEQGAKQEFDTDYMRPLKIMYLGVYILDLTLDPKSSEFLVNLTPNDIRVAMSTLRKSWINEPKYYLQKRELQRGLFMRMKGEMNILESSDSSKLAEYVKMGISKYMHDKPFEEMQSKSIIGYKRKCRPLFVD